MYLFFFDLRSHLLDGDIVLLRGKKDGPEEGTLFKLKESKSKSTHRGIIQHSDIVGLQSRSYVRSSKGLSFRVYQPSLAEYVKLTPRLVTPVRFYDYSKFEKEAKRTFINTR